MSDMDLLPVVCFGGLLLVLVVLVALLALGAGAFSYRKRNEGHNTCLSVTARRNLARVCLVVKIGNDDITFERRRIRKGQSVDFVYPATKSPGKLTVEVETGNVRTIEV